MASILVFLTFALTVLALPQPHRRSVDSCKAVDDIVLLLHAESAVAPFCSSLLHISPTTHIITSLSTPAPVFVTSTAIATNTAVVTDTQLFTSVYATTYTSAVTDVLLSTSEETIVNTATITSTSTAVATETNTSTDDVVASTTDSILETTTDLVTVVTTNTVLTTIYPPVAKRSVASPIPTPSALKSIAANLLSEACSCLSLPTQTVTATATVALTTPTSTIIASETTTVTNVISVSSTLSVENYFTVTSTTDVNSEVVAFSTETVEVTAIAAATSTSIVDITVTTTTSTQTSATTSIKTIDKTTTTIAASTATTTAAPVCGVNLVQNGDFPQASYPPWVTSSTGVSSTGTTDPWWNAECTVDPNCPLIIIDGTGSAQLSQTINTYPGQTYTLSYGYNLLVDNAGSMVKCFVDAAGSAPIVATYTGAQYSTISGTFTASSAKTLLTCSGSTTSYLWVNFEAIHVEC